MAKSSSQKASNKRLYFLIGILVVVAAATAYYALTSLGLLSINVQQPADTTGKTVQKGPEPTPTPTRLKQGKETYTYSWGEGTTVPKLASIEIDPHDPKVGQTQQVRVHMTHTSAITGVSVQLFSDNKSTVNPLTLSEGTATDGVWTGSWKVDDKVLYRYDLRILVKVGDTETPYDVILRGNKP